MKSRRPGGVAQLLDPELPGGELIQKTYTCGHCNSIKIIPVGKQIEEVSGGCYNCWRLICVPCAEKGVCTPFLRQVEEAEERGYRLQRMGLP